MKDCQICNSTMSIPEGCEPTGICNNCAQNEVIRLRASNDVLREALEKAKADSERLDWWYKRENAARLSYDKERDVWILDGNPLNHHENPRAAIDAALSAPKPTCPACGDD